MQSRLESYFLAYVSVAVATGATVCQRGAREARIPSEMGAVHMETKSKEVEKQTNGSVLQSKGTVRSKLMFSGPLSGSAAPDRQQRTGTIFFS